MASFPTTEVNFARADQSLRAALPMVAGTMKPEVVYLFGFAN